MWVLLRSRFLCETSDTMLSEPKIGTRSFCRRASRSEEHTSELQSRSDLVCRLLLEKKKKFRARVYRLSPTLLVQRAGPTHQHDQPRPRDKKATRQQPAHTQSSMRLADRFISIAAHG